MKELGDKEGVCPEWDGSSLTEAPETQGRAPLPLSGQNLFDSIKSEPFSIPEDDGNDLTHTFFNPDREGWLLKLGEATGYALAHGHRHTADSHTHSLQPRVEWRPCQAS